MKALPNAAPTSSGLPTKGGFGKMIRLCKRLSSMPRKIHPRMGQAGGIIVPKLTIENVRWIRDRQRRIRKITGQKAMPRGCIDRMTQVLRETYGVTVSKQTVRDVLRERRWVGVR